MQSEEDPMETAAGRLDVLCEVNRRLATFTDLDELLHFATRRARELFDAEGCALSLLDHRDEKRSLSVGSGEPGRAAAHSLAIRVPLRTRSGAIGVIEVVDPRRGHFTSDDRELLEALASDIAVAYEQAEFYAHVGREAAELRTHGLVASLSLVALGLSLIVGATLAHQAWALPLSELPMRPGMWAGLASAIVGALLVGVCRRSGRAKDVEIAAHRPGRAPETVVGSTVIRGDRAA
jgi:hypothetical protein